MDAIIKNNIWLNFILICQHNWLSLFQLHYYGNNAPARAHMRGHLYELCNNNEVDHKLPNTEK